MNPFSVFHRFTPVRLMFVFLLGIPWAGLPAQNYAITSGKITGGGGTSSGTGAAGAFSVTGTIGQHEASPSSSGGPYAVSGGFFAQYVALQQIGAPQIMIRPGSGGMMQVAWKSNVPGWVIQSNSTGIGPSGWVDVVAPPIVEGAEQFHEFVSSGGKRFFRLRKR